MTDTYRYGDIMRKFVSMEKTEQMKWVLGNPDETMSLLWYFEDEMKRLSEMEGFGI